MEYTTEWLNILITKYPYLLVVDVEHTCTANNTIPPNEREIIEIGAVIMCTKRLLVIDQFERFVRPVQHPTLSDFCVDLTGIQQEDVDVACSFDGVFTEFTEWLKEYDGYLFSSWGSYDLIQLNLDCHYCNTEPLCLSQTLDLKKAFAKTKKIRRIGLKRARELVGLPMVNHHRALADAKR